MALNLLNMLMEQFYNKTTTLQLPSPEQTKSSKQPNEKESETYFWIM